MRLLRWFWPASRREPRHVRLQVLHEGSDTGDMTIEGFQVSESRHWIVLDRPIVIEPDGSRKHLQGSVDIPRHRLLLRERLVAISLPELSVSM
jgi:hypothetical protein